MPAIDPALFSEAEDFANEIAHVLTSTVVDDVTVAARVLDTRVTVGPVNEEDNPCEVALPIGDQGQVRLEISFSCTWDSAGEYLMVEMSAIKVYVGKMNEPLVRFEYVRSRTYAPAHVQVHGESSALGLHLGLIGSDVHPKLRELHLPVGGKRFRVCLEDVLEFVIEDLGVGGKEGWRDAVEEGRARWHRRQLGAAVRSDQATAVATLEELGYSITPPDPA